MNSPAEMLSHRHRPLAASTEVTLARTRRAVFEHAKVAIGDLIVCVANDAAADCALRTDEFLALACDHQVRPRSLYASSERRLNRAAGKRPRSEKSGKVIMASRYWDADSAFA